MTYKEYVTVVLGKFGLSDSEIEFILSESDLNPDTIVTTSADRVLLKTAMYNHIPAMIAGLQNVSEGGYSISWNLEAIKTWFSFLADELGLVDKFSTAPTVRDSSNRW